MYKDLQYLEMYFEIFFRNLFFYMDEFQLLYILMEARLPYLWFRPAAVFINFFVHHAATILIKK